MKEDIILFLANYCSASFRDRADRLFVNLVLKIGFTALPKMKP